MTIISAAKPRKESKPSNRPGGGDPWLAAEMLALLTDGLTLFQLSSSGLESLLPGVCFWTRWNADGPKRGSAAGAKNAEPMDFQAQTLVTEKSMRSFHCFECAAPLCFAKHCFLQQFSGSLLKIKRSGRCMCERSGGSRCARLNSHAG